MPRRKKFAELRAKKAPNFTLHKLCQEKKKLHNLESKKDLKHYAKKKNAQIRAEKAPNTTL